MNSKSLVMQHQKLTWLIQQAAMLDADKLELQSHWARYICVLASGFLENALKDVFSRYARASSNPLVANFVDTQLASVQNPKSSKFVEVAGAFNKNWVQDLEDFLSLDGRKDAIDSIISNRHLIAHGKDAGITLARVKDYLAKSVQVIEHLEGACGVADNN